MIFDAMDAEARRAGFDRMTFGLDQTYERNGKEVRSKRIDDLMQAYCDYAHSGGFQILWSKEKGWC